MCYEVLSLIQTVARFTASYTYALGVLKASVLLRGSDGEASAYSAGDLGSVPGSGRSSGEGNGTPLQYSCLENPMDGGALSATDHGAAKSRPRLSGFTFTFLSLNVW